MFRSSTNFALLLSAVLPILFALGCSQSGDGLKNDVTTYYDINTSRKECEEVDFHNNSLEKENLLLAMKCMGFDKKYARLEEFLKHSSTDAFNDLVSSFNENLFAGTRARARTIDFFSKKITSDTKSEIENIASGLPDFINDFSFFSRLEELIESDSRFVPSADALHRLVRYYELSAATSFSRGRIGEFFDRYSKRAGQRLGPFSEAALKSLLNGQKREQFKSFLGELELLNSKKGLSKGQAKDLIEFVSKLEDSDMRSVTSLKRMMDGESELKCSLRPELSINIRREFEDQINALEDRGDSFYDGLNALFIKFKLLEELCGRNDQTESFKRLLKLAGRFFSIEGSTELVRAYSLSAPNKLDILDFLTSEFFLQIRALAKSFSENEKVKLGELLSSYINSYDDEARRSCETGLDIFASPEVKNLLSALRKSEGFSEFFVKKIISHEGALNFAKLAYEATIEWPGLLADAERSLSGPLIKDLFSRWQDKLSDKKLIANLKAFILSEDMARLFDLFFGRKEPPKNLNSDAGEVDLKEVPALLDNERKYKAIKCLNQMVDLIDRDGVDEFSRNYTAACKESLKDYTGSNLLLMASESSAAFRAMFAKDLFIESGIFSPEFLDLYVSSLVIWTELKQIGDAQALDKELKTLKDTVLRGQFIDGAQKAIDFIASSAEAKKLISETMLYVSQLSGGKLQSVLKKLFKDPRVPFDIYLSPSTVLDARRPRRPNETPFSKVHDLKEVAKNLIEFIDPKSSTTIGGGEVYNFDLKEALLLVYDLTDPNHVENVYHYKSGTDVAFIPMHLSERLETTIWEISFLNNFYGAYFINRIGSADDYLIEVQKLRKNIRALDVGEGLFRRMGIYPKKTLWAFKNIYNTYGALEELGQKEYGPEKRSYERPVQALLKRTVMASPDRSRDFSPFQRPDLDLVQGHAGVLLAELSKNGLLTKASLFLRKNFSVSLKERLSGPEFLRLEKIFQDLDFKKLTPGLVRIFGKEELYAQASSIFERFEKLDKASKKKTLSYILGALENALRLSSDDQVGLLNCVEILLPFISSQREYDLEILAGQIFKYSNVLLQVPGLFSRLDSNLIETLIRRKDSGLDLTAINTSSEVLAGIVGHPQFPAHAISAGLKKHFRTYGDFKYYMELFELLSITNANGQSNFETALRAVLEDEGELALFLHDIIEKISFKPPYTLSE